MKVNIGGSSNFTGLEIYHNTLRIRSDSYGFKTFLEVTTTLVGGQILTSIIVEFFFGKSASLVWSILYLFGMVYYLNSEKSQWHAAEHKIINLLKSSDQLTIENIKKSPSINEDCGENNAHLKEPSEDKLKEALRVGQEYFNKLT